MVVLDWNATLNRTPWDRIAAIWVGNAEVFRASTPEAPTQIGWHVEKDLSEYASILRTSEQVYVFLLNPVDTSSEAIVVTASLTVYEPGLGFSPVQSPDLVVPISSGVGTPWFSLTPASPISSGPMLTLPNDSIRIMLEIYATAQSQDEFWYSNVPTDYATSHNMYGGSSFREIDIFIDGKIAGVAWPFPLIYTGYSNPDLWRPIPGINTFDISPYVVNLSPFASILNNGSTHEITFDVLNNYNYWRIDGNLLISEDKGKGSVPGSLSTYEVSPNALEVVTKKRLSRNCQIRYRRAALH